MLKYDLGQLENKNWLLAEDNYNLNTLGKFESLMCAGNGYLGLRACLEERYSKECRNLLVAGLYNKAFSNEVCELANLPDITEWQIFIDGQEFLLNSDYFSIKSHLRYINYRNGELTREVITNTKDNKEIKLVFKRFVSLDNLHLIGQKIEISSLSNSVSINIKTGINGQLTNSGVQHFLELEKRVLEQNYLQMAVESSQSAIKAIITSYISNTAKKNYSVDRRAIYANTTPITIHKDQSIVFEKISLIYTSQDNDIVNSSSIGMLQELSLAAIKKLQNLSYYDLQQQSHLAWAIFYRQNAIELVSSDDIDILALRFAQYHLRIMTHPSDDRLSIAAKGLTGEGYKGHVFWDTEIFMLPYFQFSQPSIAKNLLKYRFKNIQGAFNKAQKYGYVGSLFPWESAFTGEEETPEFANIDLMSGKADKVWSSLKEHHIVADIAYTVQQYFDSTNDENFMQECGYALIFNTAIFWISRVVWQNNRYEILDIIGPDEYTEHINNNAYTNYMVKYNLDLALTYYPKLNPKQKEIFNKEYGLEKAMESIAKVASLLYLPKPNQQLVIPQDDTFLTKNIVDIKEFKASNSKQDILKKYTRKQINELQVLKQADTVMLLYLHKKLFNNETILANLDYYEPKTIHDSSLSPGIHAVLYALSGQREKAYHFFKETLKIDLGTNMVSSNNGLHAAAVASIWHIMFFGFAGISIEKGRIKSHPNLPTNWGKLSFNLNVNGQYHRLTLEQKNNTTTQELKALYGVIFDLDGVLTDTSKYHYLAWQTLAKQNNWYFDEEINELTKGVARLESLEIILAKNNITLDHAQKIELADQKNIVYLDLLESLNKDDILDGVIDLLNYLQKNNIKTAVGSISKNASFVLDKLELKHYFDYIGDGHSVKKSKPEPDLFLCCADKLGIKPELCTVIEDAKAGIEAAKRANMHVIGVGMTDNLTKADYVVKSLDLLDYKKIFKNKE